ncbi:hypothetical protein ACFVFS_17470 [Kitasatospora sp. NPDC057692]|uniref:hypothetical protein n=1 Tax=Kitasatospora sp. NPDC057692 TaxID=3346215 RepID=UPI00369C2800
MTFHLRIRVRGGRLTHAGRTHPVMTGRTSTACGKTKWANRMHQVDGPVDCPACLKILAAEAAG